MKTRAAPPPPSRSRCLLALLLLGFAAGDAAVVVIVVMIVVVIVVAAAGTAGGGRRTLHLVQCRGVELFRRRDRHAGAHPPSLFLVRNWIKGRNILLGMCRAACC